MTDLTIKIKQGESFAVDGQYVEDDGVTPKSLDGVTLSAQVRTKGGSLVAALAVTVTDVPGGRYRLSAADTTQWPVGKHPWDIREADGGVSRLSDTYIIDVQRAETKA